MTIVNLLLPALWQTLYMVFIASLISAVIGIPLGLLLFTTRKQGIIENLWINRTLGIVVNAVRSIPFIILLVAIIPLTRFIIGTTIGTAAAIVPLTLGAIPFIARIVENALVEVPYGLTEAGLSMGAKPRQIMWKILFPEALPSIINGLTVTIVAIVSFSAMAGAVGGGGLGDLGIRYGYQRFDVGVMLATVAVLIVLVQIIQMIGDYFAKLCNKNITSHKSKWNKWWTLFGVLGLCVIFITPNIVEDVESHTQNDITLGCIAGPETQLMQTVAKVAKQRYGLNVKLVEFSDYTMPNTALNDGDIDANYFQHIPYLDAQIKARDYKIAAIGKGFIYPMGLYSKKITSLQQLPDNAKIGIPNDPSNEARALLLLQKAKLITLRKGVGVNATPHDIISNPKHLQLIELDAAQLPRSLSDVEMAAITNTYATSAGLKLKDAILAESTDSPYANVLAVQTKNKNNPKLKELVKALQSNASIKEAQQLFGDGAVAAWKKQ
tara:strand:+ start:234122 stop:235606 length:1485 start_codon:yes stop_codon:yes gene_type:complete